MRDLLTLPKTHLHVHLESTLRRETLREIATKHGISLSASLTSDGASFQGFRAFADANSHIRDCLRDPADFRRMAREFCADEAAQGTRYAEIRFTAAAHGERLGDLAMPLTAMLEGLDAGQAEHGIEVQVILDHSRRRSVERAQRTLDLARRFPGRVIGLDMAGEESYSLAPFAQVIAEAKDAGLHLVHHAGESCGPPSIREALTLGRTERLGHGFRILEDRELAAEIADRGIPLEVSPSSNVTLGLVPDLPSHPLPDLLAAGLVVTLNTDIPNFTGVTLTEEYQRVRDTFGLTDPQLADLARDAADASFAPPETKAALHRGIDAWSAAPPVTAMR
ncbi:MULTISPECIES: adenosine deaminase [unclassified Crossiella]|uniref:adenosine deaminase n=1 Tax=unclassified Crossiella TaxID=2620835 RepID=UPI001FFEC13F|nr:MULTISPECIES: adenosine deaminase [unclassified Crossiella]MCK2238808.1 adenosine deaminase [Crossiella sp. S99.2]MCK2251622.1 adenosine deaminase [Crossiella sp. S99.1]